MSAVDELGKLTHRCTGCSKTILSFYACGQEDGVYCDDCWDRTPCGNGEHGPDCGCHITNVQARGTPVN